VAVLLLGGIALFLFGPPVLILVLMRGRRAAPWAAVGYFVLAVVAVYLQALEFADH
jgi:hypothetical protein